MAVNLIKEALEQAKVSEEEIVPLPYHVIFMDCQMPNMDFYEYEVTKLIRDEEQRHGIYTPIFALTAHDTGEFAEGYRCWDGSTPNKAKQDSGSCFQWFSNVRIDRMHVCIDTNITFNSSLTDAV